MTFKLAVNKQETHCTKSDHISNEQIYPAVKGKSVLKEN